MTDGAAPAAPHLGAVVDYFGHSVDQPAESGSGLHGRAGVNNFAYVAPSSPAAAGAGAPTPLAGPSAPDTERRAQQRLPTNRVSQTDDARLDELLDVVRTGRASDLHLTANARPTIRLDGSLVPIDDYPVMSPASLQRMIYSILTQKQREKFEEDLELTSLTPSRDAGVIASTSIASETRSGRHSG